MIPDLSAWGSCDVIKPLKGGYRSAPHLITRADETLVVRRTTRSEPQLRWLYRCIRLARRAGLNPPQMIPTKRGHWAHKGWRMERFIKGTPVTAYDLADLRAPLRRFHAASKSLPPCRLTRPLGLPPQLANILSRTLPKGPACAIHGDLHKGNVIRNTDGKLCLIDWDEARTGPPALDAMHLSRKTAAQRRAHYATEALEGWALEPEFARMLVRRIQAMPQKMRLHRLNN